MKTLALSLIIALVATPALASSKHRHQQIDYAKVIDVEPLYETVSYKEPERHCRIEQRTVKHRRSNTPVILSTMIGAAIGHKLGNDSTNRKIGAVAGAVLGASVGKDINRDNYTYETREEPRCETTYNVHYEEKLKGYRVGYKYRGHTYYTRTSHHPGDRIKVAVNVRPLID